MSDEDRHDDEVIARLAGLREVEPRPEFRARLAGDVERAWAERKPRRRGWLPAPLLRLASAVALLAVVALGAQQVVAAEASGPLYGARVVLEHLLIQLEPREEAREARLETLIRARAGQAAILETGGRAEEASAVREARGAAEGLYAPLVEPLVALSPPAPSPAVPAPTPVLPVATPAPRPPEPAETLFSGRLVRLDGSPVAGACLGVEPGPCAAISDAKGAFSLSLVRPAGAELLLTAYDREGRVLARALFISTGRSVQILAPMVVLPQLGL